MLTVCPKCTLTLAVTAADLRVGQGYVRCGRCATVFNALLALTDASTLEFPGSTPPPTARTPQPADTPTPGSGPASGTTPSTGATATVSVLRDLPDDDVGAAPPKAPASTPPPAGASAPGTPFRPASEARVQAEDDADEITIDPSLAAAPLDLVLEQTQDAAPSGKRAAPEFVLPAVNEDDVEEIDIDLGAPAFEDDGYERTDDTGQRAAMARLASETATHVALTPDSADHGARDAARDAAVAADPGAARGTVLEATGTVHTIVMEGTSVLQREEFVDIDTIDSEIAAATRRALEAEARKSIAALDHDAPLTATGTHRAAAAFGATGSHRVPASSTGTATGSFAVTGTATTSRPGRSPAEEINQAAAAKLESTGTATVAAEPVETRLSESGSYSMLERNPLLQPRTPPPKPPPSLLLWSTFSAALLLFLGAQAIHYWRNDIALRNDWIGQGLTKIYGVLGVPLTPNWDLRGYDVRQLGAATNGSGDNAIRVRIRLTNRATRAQPFPVLRLSLYDRYGKKVAARDLQPRDYLPKDKANTMMPVSQQIDSEVAVMDPGPNASSFELDVCTPGVRGLRCASDSPLRPTTRP